MKLFIQIPCYNEEEFLAKTLDDLPSAIDGIEKIEVIVIDDGSEDNTYEVARKHPKVSKIIKLSAHKGLAVAFKTGIETAIKMSADIIVNTDADNQYPGSEIPNLIKPIIDGRTEFVIGCRNIKKIRHFSFWKKLAQRIGSKVISVICGQNISDVTSGFRAFSRNAALWIDILASNYTYTLETLIRLANQKIKIVTVPIEINPPVRKSRLMKNNLEYIIKSGIDILTLFYIYSPFRLFLFFAFIFGLPGIFLIIRFLYFYFLLTVLKNIPTGYVQSLSIGIGLLIIGLFMLLMGVISNLIYINRKMIEKILVSYQKNQNHEK